MQENEAGATSSLPYCETGAWPLAAEQINLLAKKFDDDGEGMINYVAFCCAVDDQETSSLRSADAAKGNTFHGGFRDSRVPVELLRSLV